MSRFEAHPLPERICEVSLLGGSVNTEASMLTVGIETVTQDSAGRKIMPKKHVSFAIGKVHGDQEERVFPVPISFARDLAARINEFCDHIEAQP